MDYIAIHDKWQKYWKKNNTNKFNPKSTKPKYYLLEMFPYPSGSTLHMGHFYMYALPDSHARFKRMAGFEVFQPMGFDAFGLPAENHALKTGTHPQDNTIKNMEIMKGQFEKMGAMYDWKHSLTTCFPDYYRWNQWLFLQLYKSGLAYQKESPVNWCDKCKTVLANEQVLAGACERCDSEIQRRNMKQWFVKITDYADRLLEGLDEIDWPHKTKMMQRNWIGKSTGARIQFEILKSPDCGGEVSYDDRAKLVAEHFDRDVENYETRQIDFVGIQSKIDTIKFVPPGAKKILNLGAGTGLELEYIFAANPNAEVDCVDISIKMLEKLKQKYSDKKINIVCKDYFKHDFGKAKYDCVVSLMSFHHFVAAEKRVLYGKIFESLKDGGVFIYNDIFASSLEEEKQNLELLKRADLQDYDIPTYPQTDIDLMTAVGFSNVEKKWIETKYRAKIDMVVNIGCIAAEKKSEAMSLQKSETSLEVFTTRPDTILGVRFMVIAPEHPDVRKFITAENKAVCDEYIKMASKKSDVERQCDSKEKTGVFTGSYVVNPVNGDKVPVWIADYVLATYGTGAVMGVPAYDERDGEFAKKYLAWQDEKPPLFDGKVGKECVTYRLRDWSIGRQRYWGTPIPIIYCPEHGAVAVPEKDLPVELPYLTDFKPKGASPLANCAEFVNCVCPKCGKAAKREVDTMDTFVCSSWYFLRYPNVGLKSKPFPKDVMKVDKYIGGAEHACMHLLYSRFISQFLYDKGFITSFREPFHKLIHQGLVLAADGSKMSKSKNNFIVPDTYVDKYGSDILRLFMLFGFNFQDGGPWDESTLKTVVRFTERIENLIKSLPENKPGEILPKDKDLLYTEHSTIKAVRADLENFSFNTAVARCMEFLNGITAYASKADATPCILNFCVRTLVLLVAPMIPHIAEEYWEMIGEKSSIFDVPFPTADEKFLVRDEVEIAVQVNSKIVGRITVPSAATQSDIEKLCTGFTAGKQIVKVVYVKNRLINFIVSS